MAIRYTVSVNCRSKHVEPDLVTAFEWFKQKCRDVKKGDVVRLDAESLLRSDFPQDAIITHISPATKETPDKWVVCLFSYLSNGSGDIMVEARQWFEDGEIDSHLMVSVGAITESQILSMYLNAKS